MKAKKIRKLLIANRGEIALRIHRSAAEMGIQTVAVFSDVDRCAPHVLNATEAYPLFGNLSKETYLDIDKIINIAKKSQCDAVHPGYGFLSENADFIEAVEANGMTFVGPPASAMRAMGSKTSARDLMQKANVPIVPGTTYAITETGDAVKSAKQIGYPILIKAVHGGGGKGMRRVDHEADIEHALQQAQSESLKAFGSPDIFVEKCLLNPRHIEIQILADMHGSVIFLGERECSIQRRHQKVIEECPSSRLPENVLAKMGKAAVSAARECGYVNAGTIEFLVDSDNSFYFLEMNTRLQVEHPVTELVYGIDLVKTQLRIAQGEKLSLTQDHVIPRGHAIECRICAEDPFNNFLPSTGTIEEYAPSEGNGIRHDSGIMKGANVVHFYDPLMAKLAVWGNDREEAIQKMSRALSEYVISGVATTIPFCAFVLSHQNFAEGKYDIQFVEKYFHPAQMTGDHDTEIAASLIAASVHNSALQRVNHRSTLQTRKFSRWKNSRMEE
jgi:acetyl-CoA carboxylase, biotin carboxylase subunit